MSLVIGVIGQRHRDSGGGDKYAAAEFDDYAYLEKVLNTHHPEMTKLVSGGARGLETLVEKWAGEKAIPFQKVKPALSIFTENVPEKTKAIEAAFIVRNTEIINAIDKLVVFWNGADHLVLAAVATAIKMGKPVALYPMT